VLGQHWGLNFEHTALSKKSASHAQQLRALLKLRDGG
jgi:hypothetical protein